MDRYTQSLIEEIAPVLERLVVAQVERAVQEEIEARELVVPIWRGRWAPGLLCGEALLVEHHGRLYLARTATLQRARRGQRRLAAPR